MRLRAACALVVVCLAGTPAAAAEDVIEAWRSPFGEVRSVSVNHADGSCWVAAGGGVVHLAADGEILSQHGGFSYPVAVSVNHTDSSCWVADWGSSEVVHLSAEGAELWRGGAFADLLDVSVNSSDGSCWVADWDSNEVVHLSAEGVELWRGGAFADLLDVSVNSSDGSCWVTDWDEVVHLSVDGAELWRGAGFGYATDVSVNGSDGSCWVADSGNDQVVHLSAEGAELWRGGQFARPSDVSVNASDGSCWVADSYNDEVVHLSAEGRELWRGAGFGDLRDVSVDPTDGSCWVAGESGRRPVTHLAEDGRELWSATGFDQPVSVSVDPTDGSCWVADEDTHDVVHLSAEGAELWRGGGFSGPYGVSVDSSDGSCWVADGGHVLHLSADEVELWRGGEFGAANAVSVNPTDGSCWVADSWHNEVTHLSAEGMELSWTRITGPIDVSVDLADGSCWVADSSGSEVVHLSADGAQLWRGGEFDDPVSISADPTDSSLWVADRGNNAVIHLSSSGTELWHGEGFERPGSVSVDPTDGSCWVADTGNDQVVHLSAAGEELWRGGSFYVPVDVSVDRGDGSCWVADMVNRQVVHLVLAAGLPPTASFIATPTGGDVPLTVQFTDYSTRGVTSWSWDFGDGGASAEQHPSHTYTAIGSYTVGLTVADADGSDTETKPDYITVGPPPVADFVGHPTVGRAPLRVDFTDLSTGAPTSWEWDFGDGSTSAEQHPSHEYAEAGLYTVALTVLGFTGSDTETKPHYISVPPPPVIAIAYWPPRGTAPLPVEFRDVSTGGPFAWQWDFGDGSVSAEQNPVHVYADPGRYTVSLTATSEWGSSTLVREDLITVTFRDVPFEHWACDEVLACVLADIVGGYEDGLYRPDWEVTRDQMAVYIARALVVPSGEAALTDWMPDDPQDFPDVPTDHWAYTHIEYCVENGVVTGYEDGLYHPEFEVTRDQMAVYVARALVAPTGEAALADYVPADPRNFPDVDSDFWAYAHIEYCVENGVVQGYEDGLYYPEIVVTRDQMAVYVARAFELSM